MSEVVEEELFISVKEAARILDVSKCTIYRWYRSGIIGGFTMPSSTIKIARLSVESYQKALEAEQKKLEIAE
jgi:excisionase family DNA binding protein